MHKLFKFIGRSDHLFTDDICNHDIMLGKIICRSSFLVIGGAGSIGQAVTKEIFKRNLKGTLERNLANNLKFDLKSNLNRNLTNDIKNIINN